MEYTDYLELVKRRRKMISFTDKKVSNEDILKIIDAARYAPSGMNSQPWEFIVIRDKKSIEEIAYIKAEEINLPRIVKIIRRIKILKKYMKMPHIVDKGIKNAKNAQAMIIVCADTRKRINLPGQKHKVVHGKIILKKPLKIVDVDSIFASSMSAAFIHMLLAATTLGLGSQYITLTSSPIKEKRIKAKLGIPDHMKIYDTLALGYPKYEPRNKYTRELQDIVHFENYDMSKSQTDEYIIERASQRADMKFL